MLQADTNECTSDIPASPSPDIPASPSPDIPTICSPDTPDSVPFVEPSSRKRTKKTLPTHITKSIETLQSIKNQALNRREIEDEFYYFGKNIASQLRELPLLDALDVQSDILNLIKMKRQTILRSPKQTNCSSKESLSEYYIELPEHMFIPQQNIPNQEATIAPGTNNVLENVVEDIQDHTLLEQAIRSIGGFSETPEE